MSAARLWLYARRWWHRGWELYHDWENYAACERGDLGAALTHAGKALQHVAKRPLLPPRPPKTL